MGYFLYFRAGDSRPVAPGDLTEWGLGYLEAKRLACRPSNLGLYGGPAGVVFADAARCGDEAIGVTEGQIWRKLPDRPGRPELWVGVRADARPKPEELQRSELVPGTRVQLGDGEYWQVPLVRRWDPETERYRNGLPARWDFDGHGRPVRGKPIAKYEHLWDITSRYATNRLAAEEGEAPPDEAPSDEEIVLAAVQLLQANYAIDLPELVLCEALVDGISLGLIPLAATDYFALLKHLDERQKKSWSLGAAGASTTAGAEG